MQSDQEQAQTLEAVIAFAECFKVKLDEFTLEATVERLARYPLADVRQAVKRLITSDSQLPYGQSPLGILCAKAEDIARTNADARRQAEEDARLRITDPAAGRMMTPAEYLADNPNSPLGKYFRSRRPKPTEEQIKKARESQLRDLNNRDQQEKTA